MWDWLRAYRVCFYDTFWNIQGLKEYERIYGISFFYELKNRKIEQKEIVDIMNEQFDKTSCHFGDSYLNIATISGVYRMTLKEYDRRNGIETEKKQIRPYIHANEHR